MPLGIDFLSRLRRVAEQQGAGADILSRMHGGVLRGDLQVAHPLLQR
jgi:hypothetical protein